VVSGSGQAKAEANGTEVAVQTSKQFINSIVCSATSWNKVGLNLN
jgi:hypothetical protein